MTELRTYLGLFLVAALLLSCSDPESKAIRDTGTPENQRQGDSGAPDTGLPDPGVDASNENDIGFTNPEDLSCIDLTPLRLWNTHFSSVALLFQVRTCSGDPVQLRDGTDYVILEDDIPLSSESVPTIIPTDRMRLYVSLLLDMSDSTTAIRQELIDSAKQFVQTLIEHPELHVRVGIRLFDGRPDLVDWQLPLEDAPRLLERLNELATYDDSAADGSATNLNGAVLQGVQDLRAWQERVTDRNLGWSPTFGYAVVFTDGRDTAGRVDVSSASAVVAAAREWENGTNARPNVDTLGIALAGDDYGDIAREQFTTLLGGESFFEEGTLADLEDLFGGMADRIVDTTRSTHILTYCSASRAGRHGVTVGIHPDVGVSAEPIAFEFDADAFAPGCRAFIESSCDGVQCGGFNCGACDDEFELCNAQDRQCDNECLLNEKCAGENHVNDLGYAVACAFAPSVEVCGGVCVDTATDAVHCGECSFSCPESLGCQDGVCACVGVQPEACLQADGRRLCADLDSDLEHCGGCGIACSQGADCVSGECECPGVTPGICSATCVDFDSDAAHCGMCGNACPAGVVCAGGECQCPGVNPDICGNRCVDLDSEPNHCGGCGRNCDQAAGEDCVGGSCACPGTVDGSVCNGACVDLDANTTHCGGCSRSCNVGAGEVCAGGDCGCPGTIDGAICANACVDLDDDPSNCGSCGSTCLAGESCTNGMCSCTHPHVLCSGVCADLQSGADHCGMCGSPCLAPGVCINGQCEIDLEVSYSQFTRSTLNGGRIRHLTSAQSDWAVPHTGTRHIVMDRDPNYPNNSTTRGTARLTECFDLSAATSVKLSFWAREFSDDLESQDGLFISGTGFGYTKILSFPDSFPVYQEFIVDVEQALVTAGITDRSQVYLRVQQYGHWAISFDGIAIDDFVVSGIGSITRC